ncbi:4881_t:CDS:1, partial [Entrophospora sp. SA101]
RSRLILRNLKLEQETIPQRVPGIKEDLDRELFNEFVLKINSKMNNNFESKT